MSLHSSVRSGLCVAANTSHTLWSVCVGGAGELPLYIGTAEAHNICRYTVDLLWPQASIQLLTSFLEVFCLEDILCIPRLWLQEMR